MDLSSDIREHSEHYSNEWPDPELPHNTLKPHTFPPQSENLRASKVETTETPPDPASSDLFLRTTSAASTDDSLDFIEIFDSEEEQYSLASKVTDDGHHTALKPSSVNFVLISSDEDTEESDFEFFHDYINKPDVSNRKVVSTNAPKSDVSTTIVGQTISSHNSTATITATVFTDIVKPPSYDGKGKRRKRKGSFQSGPINDKKAKKTSDAGDVQHIPHSSLGVVSIESSVAMENSLMIKLHGPRMSPMSALTCPSVDILRTMERIVYADLENFIFFKYCTQPFPERTYVWGFVGEKRQKEKFLEKTVYNYALYKTLKSQSLVHCSTEIGSTREAADIALTIALVKMDDCLPKSVHFIVVSKDAGFTEIENQFSVSDRRVTVIRPIDHQQLDSTIFSQ